MKKIIILLFGILCFFGSDLDASADEFLLNYDKLEREKYYYGEYIDPKMEVKCVSTATDALLTIIDKSYAFSYFPGCKVQLNLGNDCSAEECIKKQMENAYKQINVTCPNGYEPVKVRYNNDSGQETANFAILCRKEKIKNDPINYDSECDENGDKINDESYYDKDDEYSSCNLHYYEPGCFKCTTNGKTTYSWGDSSYYGDCELLSNVFASAYCTVNADSSDGDSNSNIPATGITGEYYLYEGTSQYIGFDWYSIGINDNQGWSCTLIDHENNVDVSSQPCKVSATKNSGSFIISVSDGLKQSQGYYKFDILKLPKKLSDLPGDYYYTDVNSCNSYNFNYDAVKNFNKYVQNIIFDGVEICAYTGTDTMGQDLFFKKSEICPANYEYFEFAIKNAEGKIYRTAGCRGSVPPIKTEPVYKCDIVPQSIKDWIRDTLNLVRYVALALVIVLGVLDFIKAAASGEADQMKKSGQDFLKRIIAVVVLFLVPLIVELIINLIEIYGTEHDCFGLWS